MSQIVFAERPMMQSCRMLVLTFLLLCGTPPLRGGDERASPLRFADQPWIIKDGPQPMGPGPNVFARENVRINDAGKLEISITRRGDKWTCAEVSTAQPTGYGTYTFEISGPLGRLDPNVVIGLFTWNNDSFASDANSEVDIELARWGIRDDKANSLFYTVQPFFGPDDKSGKYAERNKGLGIGKDVQKMTHVFVWTPERIDFASYEGQGSEIREIARWQFDAQSPSRRAKGENAISDPVGIPKPGTQTRACINLWLTGPEGNVAPPTNSKDVQIVIDRFEYRPLKP